MKRILTYIVLAAFVFAVTPGVLAVEKKQKPKTSDTKKKESQPTKDSASSTQAKKYDTFVDKNQNGIDDRRENLKAKPEKADTSKAPAKKTGPEKK